MRTKYGYKMGVRSVQSPYGDVYLRQAREALRASVVAQTVKNLPAMQTQVLSLGLEDRLEKGTATHYSILAWRIHGQRALVDYHPWGHKRDTTE